jgi:hypothetical protein
MRILAVVGLVAALAGAASATVIPVITFDGVPVGTPVGYDFLGSGVSFSNDTTNALKVTRDCPGPPFSAPKSVIDINGFMNSHNCAEFLHKTATYVSVCMGDYDADEDSVYLEAYDSGGGLLASDSGVVPWDLNGGVTLSISATGIAYVKFWSEGKCPGSVYFDNFASDGIVPEPGAISVVGLGVLGLMGLLRRRLGSRGLLATGWVSSAMAVSQPCCGPEPEDDSPSSFITPPLAGATEAFLRLPAPKGTVGLSPAVCPATRRRVLSAVR